MKSATLQTFCNPMLADNVRKQYNEQYRKYQY